MIQRILAVFLLPLALPVLAQGATEASIDRLFTAMHVQSSVDGMYGMVEKMMKQGMSQAFPGEPTAAQRKAMDSTAASFAAVMREELSWERMRPQLLRIYSETFTEAEVLGIVAFYESPAGQAFVAKMPALLQKSMEMNQERMKELMPRMRAAVEKAAREARQAEAR
jgi:hypothetical protein